MNLIEIKAFLQENYEKDYFVYLKKQEKMILKFLELEVSGINPKKFLKTVYKVPKKSVSIFYRENLTGKTTYVE